MKIQPNTFLSGIVFLGFVGTGLELLLLDHTEDYWQLLPLFLIASGTVVFIMSLFWNGVQLWRLFRVLMVLFMISGIIGFWMHYQTNVEFEKEMYPSLVGLSLFIESMRGATPSLAPGAMIMLGFVGWLRSMKTG